MSDRPNSTDASEPEDLATDPSEESPAARIAASVSPRIRPASSTRPALFASSSYPATNDPATSRPVDSEEPVASEDSGESEEPGELEETAPAALVEVEVPVEAQILSPEPADSAVESAEASAEQATPVAEDPAAPAEPAALVPDPVEPSAEPPTAPVVQVRPFAAPEREPAAPSAPVVTPVNLTPADLAPVDPVTPASTLPDPVAPESETPFSALIAPLYSDEFSDEPDDPTDTPAPTPAPLHVAASSNTVTLVPRARRSRVGVMTGIIGGVAAVVVAAIGVTVFIGVSGATSANAGSAGATVVVEDYLGAIARSDATSALELLASDPEHPAFLSDEMLRASNAVAQLRDTTVGAPVTKGKTVQVVAAFRLGSDRVKHTFTVQKDANDDWRLESGTFRVPVDSLPGLALAINGIPVSGDTVELFPGRYSLTTTTTNFTLTGRTSIVAGGGETKPAFAAHAELDQKGIALFREIVRAGVESCLDSTALAAGCGLEVPSQTPDGSRVIDGTVKRTLSADGRAKLGVLRPIVSEDSALLVAADAEIEGVTVSMECVNKGQVGLCSTTEPLSLGTPLIDFSTSPPVLGWG